MVKPFSGGSIMPKWLYLSRLPEVYAAAGRRAEGLPMLERAAELAPDNPIVLIDLARAVLRFTGDTRRASGLLEEAKTHAISDLLAPFVTMTEGLIALKEGRAPEAVERLEAAGRAVHAFRHSSPLMGTVIDMNRAYLAIAYAKAGDMPTALRNFRLAEPRLRALKIDDILADCERALGGFAR